MKVIHEIVDKKDYTMSIFAFIFINTIASPFVIMPILFIWNTGKSSGELKAVVCTLLAVVAYAWVNYKARDLYKPIITKEVEHVIR